MTWIKHAGVQLSEKGAWVDLTRTEPSPTTSPTEDRGTYYTAAVIVPITLPQTKAFVPTFHSCLISRTYALDLNLCYHTPNASLLTSRISLRLPIQITSLPRSQPLTQPPLYSELQTTDIAMKQGGN
ncbi:hypothetical protein APSETT445_002235 [Aspergillus pseudonomiae]